MHLLIKKIEFVYCYKLIHPNILPDNLRDTIKKYNFFTAKLIFNKCTLQTFFIRSKLLVNQFFNIKIKLLPYYVKHINRNYKKMNGMYVEL